VPVLNTRTTLHLIETLLCALLSLVANVGVVDGRLQSAGTAWPSATIAARDTDNENLHVVGVLALVGVATDGTTVKLLVKDLLRMLLRLLGGVGVVEVSLVATSDVAWVRHDD